MYPYNDSVNTMIYSYTDFHGDHTNMMNVEASSFWWTPDRVPPNYSNLESGCLGYHSGASAPATPEASASSFLGAAATSPPLGAATPPTLWFRGLPGWRSYQPRACFPGHPARRGEATHGRWCFWQPWAGTFSLGCTLLWPGFLPRPRLPC